MRARLRGQAGQASIEWLAVVAVVAVVLGVAGTALAGGVGAGEVGHGVTRALARGLCLVRGGACDADVEPCVTASSEEARGWHVRAFYVQLGHDSVLVREERSDGTVALTRTSKASLGLAGGAGMRIAGLVDVSADAAILANHGTATTWEVGSVGEADRLEDGIRSGAELPRPTSTIGSWGRVGEASAGAQAGDWRAEGGFDVSDDDATQVEVATGERTVSIAHEGSLRGSVLLGGSGLAGRESGTDRYSLVYDGGGHPKELVVGNSVVLAGSAKDLPGWLAGMADTLGAPVSGGVVTTVEAHLDLGEPEARDVAMRFVSELRHPRLDGGPLLPSAYALARLLDERAVVNASTYSVEERSLGGGIDGGGLGAGAERATTDAKLVGAASRGLDGSWRRRDDCLPAA